MKAKQINPLHRTIGNGLMRTCSRQLLADFQANYMKTNSYPTDGEVRVFWTNGSTRTKLRNFFDTYLSDMIKSQSSNTKGSSYKFKVADPDRFKAYLDAAKSINLSAVPSYTTNPNGDYHAANEYWRIPIPFSQAEQQKVLDGVKTDLLIQQEKEQTATAMQQAAQAELEAYRTEQELKSEKANNNKWIIVAGLALILIIILKRTKQR